jgi:hypothetical protein
MKYDAFHDPDPAAWLGLDEQIRIQLAQDYHRRKKIRLPNLTIHATIHAIVENQVALGEEIPVRATLRRLLGEGLDRHDAIHAIGAVLTDHMRCLMLEKAEGKDPNPAYFGKLECLTLESWAREYGAVDDDDNG